MAIRTFDKIVLTFLSIGAALLACSVASAQNFLSQPLSSKTSTRLTDLEGVWVTNFENQDWKVEIAFVHERNKAWISFSVVELKHAADDDPLKGKGLLYQFNNKLVVVFGDFRRPFPESLNDVSSLPIYSIYLLNKCKDGFELLGISDDNLSEICRELQIDSITLSTETLLSCDDAKIVELLQSDHAFEKKLELKRE